MILGYFVLFLLKKIHLLWVLIRSASVPTKYMFMENWKKLSLNSHQIFILNKYSGYERYCKKFTMVAGKERLGFQHMVELSFGSQD